jgi:hypothetical protein
MSYSVSIELSEVRILAKDVPGALEALWACFGMDAVPDEDDEEAREAMERTGYERNAGFFDWLDEDAIREAFENQSLVKILDECQFEAEEEPVSEVEQLATLQEHKDLWITGFTGDRYDDEIAQLWSALAPFIQPHEDAAVYLNGEDNTHWRYIFREGRCIEQQGKIVYEDVYANISTIPDEEKP